MDLIKKRSPQERLIIAKTLIESVLDELPSAQPETHDKRTETHACDCISRQAVKEWLDRWEGYIDKDVIARMKYRTIDIPSAQPETAKRTAESTQNVSNEDLISRKMAISAVNTALFPKINTAKEAEKALRLLPSAQHEIVRCKKCEHYDDGLCRRWKYSHVTSEDSFCSFAERGTDE